MSLPSSTSFTICVAKNIVINFSDCSLPPHTIGSSKKERTFSWVARLPPSPVLSRVLGSSRYSGHRWGNIRWMGGRSLASLPKFSRHLSKGARNPVQLWYSSPGVRAAVPAKPNGAEKCLCVCPYHWWLTAGSKMNTSARKWKGEQAAQSGHLMPLMVAGKRVAPSLPLAWECQELPWWLTPVCPSDLSLKYLSWPPKARESSRDSLIPLLGTMILDVCLPPSEYRSSWGRPRCCSSLAEVPMLLQAQHRVSLQLSVMIQPQIQKPVWEFWHSGALI